MPDISSFIGSFVGEGEGEGVGEGVGDDVASAGEAVSAGSLELKVTVILPGLLQAANRNIAENIKNNIFIFLVFKNILLTKSIS